MEKEIRRELILSNYENPFHKRVPLDKGYLKVNSNNESCIDNLDFYLLIEDGKLLDAYFDGEACAISTSATSMMLKNLVGKDIGEIKKILENYQNMIFEKEYDQELLKELNAFDEIYHQPNRKTCALLPVKGILKALEEKGYGN